ncbi:uncharacterized protein LOC110027410 isoform X2 [Phalaenopsis equestris]|uniref:uncharacterized protein LOC110027410 isoform X2 n=1 Tax=Phalaenopsis equestris TaxID=78828 RepID=UPI0009E266E1|nr:uncharacterized protein LOC110027410 isoform X2 [Phalaenopsis equestris]
MGDYRGFITADILLRILWILTFFSFSHKIAGIRKDAGFLQKLACRNTVHGRYLLADDNGYVCSSLSVYPWTSCCPETGERFSCQGCNLISKCCNSYQYCVSCCLNPSMTQEDAVLKLKIAKPVTAGTYSGAFDFCVGRCRHNSASVVHENAYASDFHHCYSLQTNFSGVTEPNFERRLAGIDIVIGKLEKYMRCKGSCFASMGADQPAEVVDNAPKDMYPGACLYSQADSMLSCDGSHKQTRRLCPCA